jgi:hypothetical protein
VISTTVAGAIDGRKRAAGVDGIRSGGSGNGSGSGTEGGTVLLHQSAHSCATFCHCDASSLTELVGATVDDLSAELGMTEDDRNDQAGAWMVSCPAPGAKRMGAGRPRKIPVHIVTIAWLYVTFAMALAMPGVVGGAAFFLGVGMAPALVACVVAVRRLRRRRADARSAGQDPVHRRDHAEAQADR